MSKSSFFILFLSTAACDYQGPPCEDITHDALEVDLSSGAPVFSWTGDNANDLWVHSTDETIHWELSCDCKSAVDRPDANKGCSDRVDWDYRACLASPVTYGEVPTPTQGSIHVNGENDISYQTEALELTSGSEYDVWISSVCDGDDTRHVEQNVTFTVP